MLRTLYEIKDGLTVLFLAAHFNTTQFDIGTQITSHSRTNLLDFLFSGMCGHADQECSLVRDWVRSQS